MNLLIPLNCLKLEQKIRLRYFRNFNSVSRIKSKTAILQSSSCDYIDVYLFKELIEPVGAYPTVRQK